MDLSTLKPPKGAHHKNKRVGRGVGSGHGKTSTRGHKGQYARSGSKRRYSREGGQMPLHRRLPKRGFTNIFRKEFAIINVGALEKLAGDTFDPQSLTAAGVVKKLGAGLKVLGTGELKRKITVRAHQFSESAAAKITAAGGVAEVIETGKK